MDTSDNDGLFDPGGSASMSNGNVAEDSILMTGTPPAAAKRRILVVEDEMLIGMLLELSLIHI